HRGRGVTSRYAETRPAYPKERLLFHDGSVRFRLRPRLLSRGSGDDGACNPWESGSLLPWCLESPRGTAVQPLLRGWPAVWSSSRTVSAWPATPGSAPARLPGSPADAPSWTGGLYAAAPQHHRSDPRPVLSQPGAGRGCGDARPRHKFARHTDQRP